MELQDYQEKELLLETETRLLSVQMKEKKLTSSPLVVSSMHTFVQMLDM
jgi:hypothetical protein